MAKSTSPKPRYPEHDAVRRMFQELVTDESETGIVPFCQHAGIVMPQAAEKWWPTFLVHYTGEDGAPDHSRMCNDLATFPPVLRRVQEIQREMRRHG